jgi:hypothetical protein
MTPSPTKPVSSAIQTEYSGASRRDNDELSQGIYPLMFFSKTSPSPSAAAIFINLLGALSPSIIP